jgi:hypothetical protein
LTFLRELYVKWPCCIAQAISRWLPTVAVRVRARVRSCGICDEQSGTGTGFLRVLRFSLPIFIPPVTPQSPSSIIRGWYNRPVVAIVPSGLSLTPLIIIIMIMMMMMMMMIIIIYVKYCILLVHSLPKFRSNALSCGGLSVGVTEMQTKASLMEI